MCKNTWLSAWIKLGLKAEPLLTFKCVSVRATEQTDTFLNDVWWVFSGLIRSRRTNTQTGQSFKLWLISNKRTPPSHPHHHYTSSSDCETVRFQTELRPQWSNCVTTKPSFSLFIRAADPQSPLFPAGFIFSLKHQTQSRENQGTKLLTYT